MELEAPGRCWKAAHSRRRWNGTYEDFESTCPCVPSQWVIQSAVGNLPLNVMSCTCICAESQEVTWSPPHAQLPGGTSSVDSAQASSVELLTSVSDDDGGGGHGCGAGGEVAHVAAVLPSWMVDQGMVSQIVSQMASQRGGEDRLPGRWWYGILTAKRGSENDLGSTCPIRVIRSVLCDLPMPWPASWLLAVGHPVSLYWSVLCSQTREASCPTGYASQSEISSGGTICAGVLTLGKQEKKIGD